MKRIIVILAVATLGLSGITACNSTTTKTGVAAKKSKYMCTMHPDLSFDKPGVCSKCGMELVERDITAGK